jgi:hypothetical protein
LAIVIQPYLREHEQAVQEFNRRLQESSGDPDLVFSQTATPRWLPPAPGQPVWNEFFVAIEGSTVRGTYALKQETIWLREKGLQRIACYHHPLSEGIIDRSYASVGVLLARDALARQPFLYALGMGGYDRPIAKMLKALGFSMTLIPFYFRVVHPSKFFWEMQALRQTRWRAMLMNIAAASGAGFVAIKSVQAASRFRRGRASFETEEISEFSDWAEDLWHTGMSSVSLATVRDANTLRLLYPKTMATKRLRVSSNGVAVGWAIVGERRKSAAFGQMRVGSIVDCWAAAPEDTASIVRAATAHLEKLGVDLIVSNQSHQAWRNAFERSGFLKGPSNFIFAASKKLRELLQPLEENRDTFHITRADGDGLPANF